MKQLKSTTNTQFFLGLICVVSLLSLMPFMHFHEHVHDHAHCHEHEDTESSNTDEGCPANSDE
ncbi:hypothetical protein JT359_20050, partial [Candidatus Poribacteria bacterium]|nr:hypothetical protein [Candidatus Poribacteria bacterium]